MHRRIPAVALSIPALLCLASCSTIAPPWSTPTGPLAQAARDLRDGRKISLTPEARAAAYLSAADLASREFGHAASESSARAIYNDAAAELTDFLRDTQDGQLWNRPLTTTGGTAYRLRFQVGSRDGLWSPEYFTDFRLARGIKRRAARHSVVESGVGGTLVGIYKSSDAGTHRRTLFEPRGGFVAPVTSTIDFQGSDATLALSDPAERKTVRIRGKVEPLAADFTAPLCVHPPFNELWHGLMGLVHADQLFSTAGLYMLHPYDPDRIPVILVHGLISTQQMWVNVINEVEADPLLRGRFQFWTFSYPTGIPASYSALRCREELAKMNGLHPGPRSFVMVGHSMGGLIARMQATDTGRVLWNGNFRNRADVLYAKLPADHLVKRELIYKANPGLKRLVFICVPHRGSGLAISSIGALGMRLIKLPGDFVATLTDSIGDVLKTASGQTSLPNGITSLSPRNRTLLALDKLPIRAPYHSIIGDRGRGDSPHSSDWVVPYRSSHLEGAQSELIVPGPHSSYELPQTIEELKRILRLQLATAPRSSR